MKNKIILVLISLLFLFGCGEDEVLFQTEPYREKIVFVQHMGDTVQSQKDWVKDELVNELASINTTVERAVEATTKVAENELPAQIRLGFQKYRNALISKQETDFKSLEISVSPIVEEICPQTSACLVDTLENSFERIGKNQGLEFTQEFQEDVTELAVLGFAEEFELYFLNYATGVKRQIEAQKKKVRKF